MTIRKEPLDALLKTPLSKEKEAAIRQLAKSSERLKISVTNDFAFKTIFRNKKVLKGLLSALLDISVSLITSIELPDPAVLGEFSLDKIGIVDIKVILNNRQKITLEMQVLPFPFWEERTLFYLSKMFVENFKRGMDYGSLDTCIMISILKYDLFECEDFYSKIQLADVKTGRLYSDKISLRVLQLNQLEKAAKQEGQNDLYLWAKMISADDWEVLEMLAKQNEYISEAVNELEKINSDPAKHYEYLYREMKELDENTIRNYFMDKGRSEGRSEGIAMEKNRYSRLIMKLSEAGEIREIVSAASDPDYLEELYRRYGI